MLMLWLLGEFSAVGVKSNNCGDSRASGDTGADLGVVGPTRPVIRRGVRAPFSGVTGYNLISVDINFLSSKLAIITWLEWDFLSVTMSF